MKQQKSETRPVARGRKLYASPGIYIRHRRDHHELESIFHSIPAMVFMKDLHNRVVRINRAALAMIGMRPRDILGKDLTDLFPSSDIAGYWRDDREVILTGRPKKNIVEKIETVDGPRWIRADKIPYKNRLGAVSGVIGFALDITDVVRMAARGDAREARGRREEQPSASERGAPLPELGCAAMAPWTHVAPFPFKSFPEAVKTVKRTVVEEALRRTNGSRQAAADLLGISRHALFRLIKNLDIQD
jgi:PAS domain S-box-containing protein